MEAEEQDDGRAPRLSLGGGVEAVFHLEGSATQDRMSVIEHPMAPGSLIEPHTHSLEDEYSFVLEGTLGVLLGDLEFEAVPGTLVDQTAQRAARGLERRAGASPLPRDHLAGWPRALLPGGGRAVHGGRRA